MNNSDIQENCVSFPFLSPLNLAYTLGIGIVAWILKSGLYCREQLPLLLSLSDETPDTSAQLDKRKPE